MRFADSHCHLTDARFAEDRAEVLERARGAGVHRVITIASDAEDSVRALGLARTLELARTCEPASLEPKPGHLSLWCTAGVHPHSAGDSPAKTDMGAVRDLAANPLCVAIGEAGLDYHYDFAPGDAQRRVFSRQATLAADLDLPLVVHSRSAENDTAAAIRECAGTVTGVLHCFTGPESLLEAALESGWWVSFTGIATFKSFDGSLAGRTPSDRYMIETDAPYLAPIPKRGRRNEPALVVHVAEALARIRGESLETVAADSWSNTERFFGLGTSGDEPSGDATSARPVPPSRPAPSGDPDPSGDMASPTGE